MKISQVIEALQEILEKQGDLDVQYYDEDGLQEVIAVEFYESRDVVLIQ